MKTHVVSTAKRRKSPSVRKQFLAVSDRFKYQQDYVDRSKKDRKPDTWNKYVPVSPQEAKKILLRGLPKNITVSVYIDEDGGGAIEYSGDAIDQVYGTLDLKHHKYSFDWVKVNYDTQQKGLGRIFIRNQLEFLKVCGVKKAEITAGLDVGGYAWARTGFLPEKGELPDLRAEMQERYKMFRPFLNDTEKELLDKVIKMRRRKDLWEIADDDTDLSSRLKETFKRAAGPDFPKKKREAYYNLKEHFEDGLDSYTYPFVTDRIENNRPIKLGPLLLLGKDWTGYIDLNNALQMQHVEKYVGGFKYIGYETPEDKPKPK